MLRTLMLAALCAPAAHAADWSPRNTSGVSGLVVQSAAAPPDGRPLLVVLHGCAQPNSALQQAGLAAAAEAAGGVVALPAVPGGGVFAGCWDYYGPTHTDATRHLGPLISFVDALVADPALQIDPARVWIAGLSSGAGQALVAACVAPDLFSGVAAVGGPGLGTEAAQIAQVSTSSGAVTSLCRQISRAPAAFAQQQAVLLAGTRDFIVAQGYAPVNADGFAALYGATLDRSEDLSALPGGAAGSVQYWQAGGADRVALITVDGLDHAWPAGRGAGATMQFVAPGGPDLGAWLFEFFGGVDGSPPPAPEPSPTPPRPDPEDCPPATAEAVEDTLVGHAPRLGVHGGVYGAVDIAYVDLLGLYGTTTRFLLHRGPDGWYHDPALLPAAECDPSPAPPAGEPGAPPTPPPTAPATPEPAPPEADQGPRGPQVIQKSSGCSTAPGHTSSAAWWCVALLALRRRRTGPAARTRGPTHDRSRGELG